MAMFRNVNLAPIDASGFERAGAAYGQMFQNLGNTIAQNVETKRIKKEEKQRNQATANFILKNKGIAQSLFGESVNLNDPDEVAEATKQLAKADPSAIAGLLQSLSTAQTQDQVQLAGMELQKDIADVNKANVLFTQGMAAQDQAFRQQQANVQNIFTKRTLDQKDRELEQNETQEDRMYSAARDELELKRIGQEENIKLEKLRVELLRNKSETEANYIGAQIDQIKAVTAAQKLENLNSVEAQEARQILAASTMVQNSDGKFVGVEFNPEFNEKLASNPRLRGMVEDLAESRYKADEMNKLNMRKTGASIEFLQAQALKMLEKKPTYEPDVFTENGYMFTQSADGTIRAVDQMTLKQTDFETYMKLKEQYDNADSPAGKQAAADLINSFYIINGITIKRPNQIDGTSETTARFGQGAAQSGPLSLRFGPPRQRSKRPIQQSKRPRQ